LNQYSDLTLTVSGSCFLKQLLQIAIEIKIRNYTIFSNFLKKTLLSLQHNDIGFLFVKYFARGRSSHTSLSCSRCTLCVWRQRASRSIP